MKSLFFKSILLVVFLAVAVLANAQIKYYSNGKLTIGNTEPYSFYHTTFSGNGIYMNVMLVTSFKLIVARLQLDWLVIMIKLFSIIQHPEYIIVFR